MFSLIVIFFLTEIFLSLNICLSYIVYLISMNVLSLPLLRFSLSYNIYLNFHNFWELSSEERYREKDLATLHLIIVCLTGLCHPTSLSYALEDLATPPHYRVS